MGIFDNILEVFKIDDSKKKTSHKKSKLKKEKSKEQEKRVPSFLAENSERESSGIIMDVKIKEMVNGLQKEREELCTLFDNNLQRIRDMGNTLICQSSDRDHESLIWDILKCFSPNHLKLIMMDETGIVYSPFQDIPHLLIPVVRDPKENERITNWLYGQCLSRFRDFMDDGVNNIDEYNARIELLNGDRCRRIPYIIYVVHEVALSHLDNKDAFIPLLLNGNKAGIYFLMFSMFSAKNLPLGREMDLLSMKSIVETRMFFQFTTTQNRVLTYSDNMSGIEFEYFCCELLKKKGYEHVEVTKASADYGCDLIAIKDQVKYAIQCKKYSSPVGITAIQEVIASKAIYGCHVAAVLTNSTFTSSATKLALDNNVLLWNGDYLHRLYEQVSSVIDIELDESESNDNLLYRIMEIEKNISILESKQPPHLRENSQKTPVVFRENQSTIEKDEYFEAAARFIIEKDEATIEMIQQMFKIGFNRSARIIDQLADAGIVGPEEGTKPREILMSPEELDKYLEKYV